MTQPASMDTGLKPRLIALLLLIGLCAIAAAVGCEAPHEREIEHPTPVVTDKAPDQPAPKVELVTTRSHRGIEVQAPDYIVKRTDLFTLALREIDSAGMHNLLSGWVVEITPPTGQEGTLKAERRLRVRWRADDHEPTHVMLPNLNGVVDEAVSARFGD